MGLGGQEAREEEAIENDVIDDPRRIRRADQALRSLPFLEQLEIFAELIGFGDGEGAPEDFCGARAQSLRPESRSLPREVAPARAAGRFIHHCCEICRIFDTVQYSTRPDGRLRNMMVKKTGMISMTFA